MRIEHIAIWTDNLERLRDFYCTYFQGVAGERYHNPEKNFESYFLHFDSGARMELMRIPGIRHDESNNYRKGLAHLAISVGSVTQVNELTSRLRNDGFVVVGEPRTTGDGYYESVISDPDGNLIEITI